MGIDNLWFVWDMEVNQLLIDNAPLTLGMLSTCKMRVIALNRIE